MKKRILWIPILGFLHFGKNIFKYKLEYFYPLEFLLWVLYQSVCITLCIYLIKNYIIC